MGYNTGSEPHGNGGRPPCADAPALTVAGAAHGDIGHVCPWPPRAVPAESITTTARMLDHALSRTRATPDEVHEFMFSDALGARVWTLARIAAAGCLFDAAGERDRIGIQDIAAQMLGAFLEVIGVGQTCQMPSEDSRLRAATLVAMVLDDEPPDDMQSIWASVGAHAQVDVLICLIALAARLLETTGRDHALGGDLAGFADELYEELAAIADDAARYNHSRERILSRVSADRHSSWIWFAALHWMFLVKRELCATVPSLEPGEVPKIGAYPPKEGADPCEVDYQRRAVDLINASLRGDRVGYLHVCQQAQAESDFSRVLEGAMMICVRVAHDCRTGNSLHATPEEAAYLSSLQAPPDDE